MVCGVELDVSLLSSIRGIARLIEIRGQQGQGVWGRAGVLKILTGGSLPPPPLAMPLSGVV